MSRLIKEIHSLNTVELETLARNLTWLNLSNTERFVDYLRAHATDARMQREAYYRVDEEEAA